MSLPQEIAAPESVIGSINFHVAEGRNLARMDFKLIGKGKSDPYSHVSLTDGVTSFDWKSKWRKNNLNPTWKGKFHRWIQALPIRATIMIYDYDTLGKDDFMGMVEVEINEQNAVVDDWFPLQKRPGKKDKKVKGDIRIIWDLSFFNVNNFDPDAWWSDYTHIVLEPFDFLNCVEIQGPISDIQMLTIWRDTRCPVPEKIFDKKVGIWSGWLIPVCKKNSLTSLNPIKNKWRYDKTQNVALTILNSLAHMGYVLRRSDQIHRINTGGDNNTQTDTYDKSLWMVKELTPENRWQDTSFLIVEPIMLINSFYMEIQGNLTDQLHANLAQVFQWEQVIDDLGNHLLWRSRMDLSKWSFSLNSMRTQENRMQNFMLQVMNIVKDHGYQHVTVWGQSQIFVRVNQPVPQGNFLTLDPFIFMDQAQVEVQGIEVNQELMHAACNFLGAGQYEIGETKDKAGYTASWYFNVLGLPKINYMSFSVQDCKTRENMFQNFFLQVVAAFDRMGWSCLGPMGHDALLLQRTHQPWADANYVLIDPNWNFNGLMIEIQGFPDNLMNDMGIQCGFNQIVKREDKGIFLSYEIHVAKSSGFSVSSFRKKQNLLQMYLMRILTWLHNSVCFEPMTQFMDDDVIIRYNPNRIPGSWMLLDINYVGFGKIAIEIQGDITMDELIVISETCDLPNPETMDYKGEICGWRIKTGFYHWGGAGETYTNKARMKQNRWQSIWLKTVNTLRILGWEFKFPYSKGYTPGHIFFKANVV
eukprot:TRINITY_DN5427_c0_g1_i1.p1 TRINITY_DN5427_c0_g1~~TRINITY_DN5427_c0_g1_i1.p1  ORF type:complete len:754 (-),score=118.18 TRINITY_DN5427_c0_g1_i1:2139-4400(-)